MEYDTLGNKLTLAQAGYFADSKVKRAGKLIVCYHYTNEDFDSFDDTKINSGASAGFNMFGSGFYFTDNGNAKYNVKYKKVVYLNITKPYYLGLADSLEQIKDFITKAGGDFSKYSDTTANTFVAIHECCNITGREQKEFFAKEIRRQGYDGIIARGKNFSDYVVYKSNQVKLIENKNPTESENMNENIRESIDFDEFATVQRQNEYLYKFYNDGYGSNSYTKARLALIQDFKTEANKYPYFVIRTSKWYDPEGLDIKDNDYNIVFAGTYAECQEKIDRIYENTLRKNANELIHVEDYEKGKYVKIYAERAIAKSLYSIIKNPGNIKEVNENMKLREGFDEEIDNIFTDEVLNDLHKCAATFLRQFIYAPTKGVYDEKKAEIYKKELLKRLAEVNMLEEADKAMAWKDLKLKFLDSLGIEEALRAKDLRPYRALWRMAKKAGYYYVNVLPAPKKLMPLFETTESLKEASIDPKAMPSEDKDTLLKKVVKVLSDAGINTYTLGLTLEQGGIDYDSDKIKKLKSALFEMYKNGSPSKEDIMKVIGDDTKTNTEKAKIINESYTEDDMDTPETFTPEEQEEYEIDETGLQQEYPYDQYRHCVWCGKVWPESDMAFDIDLGWICPHCEEAIMSHGERLTIIENKNRTNKKSIKDLHEEYDDIDKALLKDMIYDGIHAAIKEEGLDLDQEVIDDCAEQVFQEYTEVGNTLQIYELINKALGLTESLTERIDTINTDINVEDALKKVYNNDFEEMQRLAEIIGIDTAADLDNFLGREAMIDEEPIDTLKRYIRTTFDDTIPANK